MQQFNHPGKIHRDMKTHVDKLLAQEISLLGKKYFTSLDFASGYYQVQMSHEAQEKATSVTCEGTFAHTVLPSGDSNGPARFAELLDSIDHSNVKKLEGSRDYPLWKINLENIFWASGLDQVVFGKEKRPSSDADKQRAWDILNRAGMGIILQTVDEKLTSYEFYQSSLGERTATELVNSLQTISGQLKAMGYTSLDEEAILSKALHELRGPRYDSFVSAWDVVPDKEKTIVNLVQKLNIHQSREEIWCKDTVSEKAFSSVKAGEAHGTYLHKTRSGPENGNGKEERKKKKRCYNCGFKGHIKADCRFPLKKKEGETSKDKKKDENNENNKEPSDKKKNFVYTTDKSFMIKSSRHATRDAYVWYCDSGTNVHVCGRREWFVSYEEFETPRKLQVATNTYADCPGEGTVAVQACIKGNWEMVSLTKVLFLPKGANLFSQNRMLKRGFYAQSSGEGTTFFEQNGKESLKAKLSEDGMQIMLFKPVEKDPKAFMCASQKRALQRWHERLAHVGFKYLKHSVNKQAVFLGRQNELEDEYRCEVCIKAKATLKPYPTQSERNYETGELLHFDLGHAVSRSNQGNKYFLLVKDNESSYRVVYFQNTKLPETTVRNVKDAVEMFSNQVGLRVKRLKSDKGCEFKNHLMEQFISEKGIIYEYTPAGCSQANGKIEREVRTVRNTARALLLEAGLPPAFWQDAVGMAVYTLNRLLSSTNKEMTPHEILFGRKPNLSHTRIFGCPASARLLTPKGEWTTRTREGIFVGHVPDTREYKLYDRKNGEYFLSRHVDFFEDYIPYRPSSFVREIKFYESEEEEEEDEVKTESKSVGSQLTEIDLGESKDEDVLEIHADTLELLDETTVLSWSDQMEENSAEEDFHDATVGEDETENWIPEGSQVYDETMPEEASNDETATTTTGNRKSKRTNKGVLPKRYANSALEIQQKLNELTLQDKPLVEPKSYEEALSCWDRMEWKEAMKEEIHSQLANDTWELSGEPAVVGYNRVSLKINLISPCSLLPTEGLDPNVVKLLVSRCEAQYERLFRGELVKICINNSTRVKRVVPVVGVIAVGAIASAGVGLGGYALYKTMELEENQEEIMRTLDDLEDKVAITSSEVIFLKEKVKKMVKTVNRLIEDVNLFQEKAIEVQFITAYIVSRLVVGRGVVLETKRLWRKGRMDDQFFEYLNLTLPCRTACPLDYGEFKGCYFNEEENSILVDFLVPIVNENLTIIETDPFFLMVKDKSQMCKLIYNGPRTALVSRNEDCVFSAGRDFQGKFMANTRCKNFSDYEKSGVFKLDSCVPMEEGNEETFIQSVFKLPLTSTFSVNNVTYRGRMLNLVYNEKEDPLFLEKVTWHLTPVVNWDELNKTFPYLTPLDADHWGRERNRDFWIMICIIGAVFLTTFLIVLWEKLRSKCVKKKRHTCTCNHRHDSEMRTLRGNNPEDAESSEESIHG
ncbi:Copia protein [Folsomia candida]|uniref:Copia protein n=1 Tax=Folsomia candida TaxID=158441 RepID=A0A226EI65_FOLCA|nr:Copia protein [Folsomia candida]